MHRRDVTLGVSAPTSATGAGKPRRLLAWRMGPKGSSAANWARQPRASERIASAPTAKFARLARHFGREETADFPSSPRFPLPTPMPNFHSAQGRPDNSRPPRRRSRRRKGRRVRSCSPSRCDEERRVKTNPLAGVQLTSTLTRWYGIPLQGSCPGQTRAAEVLWLHSPQMMCRIKR